MLGYYLELAIHSLRRNLVLTVLMVAAIGVGIGTCMMVLTTLVAMSGNPIPDKSAKLFVPLIDVWGPESRRGSAGANIGQQLPTQLTYRDATTLMRAQRAVRQTAMYAISLNVSPPGGAPFQALGRATYADFFTMFEVPFRNGTSWGRSEDDKHANVVVLSSKLAERVFPHDDPVGKLISLNARDYRVVGVIQPWTPTPKFYDLSTGAYSDTDDFYVPFTTAIDRQTQGSGSFWCNVLPASGWEGRLNSECVWLQFWVELPTAAAVRNFRSFLQGYAAQQRQLGRFHWPPRVELHDVMDWMVYNNVIPEEVRVNVLIGTGFLVVCLVNAVGLMLARFSSRSVELGLRRALGASRMDLFLQGLTETLVVGVLGGLLGLALTGVGLSGLRALLAVTSKDSAAGHLVALDAVMVLITMVVAVLVTVGAGLYPTLRASRIQPAWQLKAQ
ncbi:MAG TPA: ABC transporter permease [Steroidobacteraceae bacterium]